MPIVIFLVAVFFNASLSYGQEAPEGSESSREEASDPFYAPLYRSPSQVKESHAYYNRHAGQMVEISALQTNSVAASAGRPLSGKIREIRSFYNRHAGQTVEVPLDNKPQGDSEKSFGFFNRDDEVYKYNPYSRQWERAVPETQLTYNPYARTWSYEKEGAYPRYNPYNDTWEQATDNETLQYNHENNGWSYRK